MIHNRLTLLNITMILFKKVLYALESIKLHKINKIFKDVKKKSKLVVLNKEVYPTVSSTPMYPPL